MNDFADTVLNPWSKSSIAALARGELELPTTGAWKLEGDFRVVMLRWLAESAVPPGLDGQPSHVKKARIFEQARRLIEVIDPLPTDMGGEARSALIMALGRAAWLVADGGERAPLSLDAVDRRELLDVSGSPPGCYLCGSRFGREATDGFLGGDTQVPSGYPYVDFLFPRGMRGSDFLIEVDHIRPRASGGGHSLGNLRLACRYCNRMKSDALTILDRTRYGKTFGHPSLGSIKTPHPSWVLRLLAMSGECSICAATSRSRRMLVAPGVWSRLINPTNLRVYCESHDPIIDLRSVPRGAWEI